MGGFAVNLPWLAFCSAAYLRREDRVIPLPCADLRHCPDRYAYTDVTTLLDAESGLPRTIDLFTSRIRFLGSHAQWDKVMLFGDRYAEWEHKTVTNLQEGVLVFHYAALESTNLLGREFPTKFELFQTGCPYEQDGNWFCQGTGRVISIHRVNMSEISK